MRGVPRFELSYDTGIKFKVYCIEKKIDMSELLEKLMEKSEIIKGSKGSSKSRTTGLDVYDIIDDLLDEGFFRTPVTSIEVANRTTKRGIVLSERVKERATKKLYSLVSQKKLAKFKQAGKSVYQER